jgi:hypothetical protein
LSKGEHFEGGIASPAKEDSDGDKEREDDIEHESILLTRRYVASPGQAMLIELADFKPSWPSVYRQPLGHRPVLAQ